MRDHGGNLDAAIARYGARYGALDGSDDGSGGPGWIDLSTGINRRPYPLPPVPAAAFAGLPTAAEQAALVAAAARLWRVAPAARGVALAGAQAAIQLVPQIFGPPGRAAVLGPTYNEHAACLAAAGWQVAEVTRPADLHGADLAVVVNPNNPDGRQFAPADLLTLRQGVGALVVDESFGDVTPDLSLLPQAGGAGLLILRSFGKFWGLAGLRLGFAFGDAGAIAALSAQAGPWPVPGPAIAVGRLALADAPWAAQMRAQLAQDAARADALARAAGWQVAGGTPLFRLYDTADAAAAQDRLARHRIWSRIFPWSARWLRLGLPGPEAEWQRLAAALA